jgi:hypothetical protein
MKIALKSDHNIDEYKGTLVLSNFFDRKLLDSFFTFYSYLQKLLWK